MAKKLWLVEGHATAIEFVWAETSNEASNGADFDQADWEIETVREADAFDIEDFDDPDVWDGKEWLAASLLMERCSPEAVAQAEADAKAREEWEAHPKLLEV